MNEEKMYDVIVVEDGKIATVTVWKKCDLARGMRLAARYHYDDSNSVAGVILSGAGHLNMRVTEKRETVTIPKYIVVDGRKIKGTPQTIDVVLFEKVEITSK